MAKLGRKASSRRLWWFIGFAGAVSIAASFGTPKAGCAGSAEDEDEGEATELAKGDLAPESASADAAAAAPRPTASAESASDAGDVRALQVIHTPPAVPGYTPLEVAAIGAKTFCPTAGKVVAIGPRALRVNGSGMRGVVAADFSHSAELAFVFHGESDETVPLANGELRQQIGIKLRAQDTCNVIYVMWRIAPTTGVWVQTKSNPGQKTHAECGDRGYKTLESTLPKGSAAPPSIVKGEAHTLRADLDSGEDHTLRVHVDGQEVWRGVLPDEAFAFDGPAGTRSDNGTFDFELRVPGGQGQTSASCINPGTESAH